MNYQKAFDAARCFRGNKSLLCVGPDRNCPRDLGPAQHLLEITNSRLEASDMTSQSTTCRDRKSRMSVKAKRQGKTDAGNTGQELLRREGDLPSGAAI